MRVKFWGVRGSIPTPMTAQNLYKKAEKILAGAKDVDLEDKGAIRQYLDGLDVYTLGPVGGNSSCVELRAGDQLLIFDAGSGIRELGLDLMKTEFGKGQGEASIFFGHTHWDHIMGFPFFVPAYIPGNKITFYSCHDKLKHRIIYQQVPTHFPVPLEAMASGKDFIELEVGKNYDIGGVSVTPFELHHPGSAYGYRVEHEGRVFCYASDTEFKKAQVEHTQDLKDADVLVLDTMYTFDEMLAKTDWGHCSPFIGVDVCLNMNVKKLVLFHHEPTYSDRDLEKLLKKTRKYKKKMSPDAPLEIELAYEGLEIDF